MILITTNVKSSNSIHDISERLLQMNGGFLKVKFKNQAKHLLSAYYM